MKRFFISLMACGLGLAAMAQQDEVLMTIDGKPIMTSEFMYIYQKNAQDSTMEKKTMDEYLQMFTNFKLKVAEAESQGLDTTESFAQELKGYRAQAIPKYMQDQQAVDSLVLLSYNRMCFDRRAAHIAVECPSDASDSAQQAALARINQARTRVLAGENFGKVAAEMSTVPSAKEDQGELGWITPFRYVYAFEDAIYNTPVGGYTEVFRSPYGYHFAWVEEKKMHEDVHAAHIMKMVPGGDSAINVTAQAQIDSLYQVLSAGADFAKVAMQQSDDKGSAMRGGDLGWFGRGMMVHPFEDSVFALPVGAMSQPFRSRFGWHIAKVDGRRPVMPLDSLREQIEKKVLRDERHKEADKAFIRKARAEYKLGDNMTDDQVREYVDQHLEEKYEDLRHLVREYHDGILLFDVSLANVWDKASQDEEGLTNYFNAHKAEYVWDAPRWKGYIIYAKDDIHAKAAKNIIKVANPDSINSYLESRINNDSVKYVRIEYGVWQKGQRPVVDQKGFKVKGAKYESPTMPIALLQGKIIKAPQEYKDERGKVVADYQDELEKIWVEELKQKHTIQINQDVFDKLR